MAAVKNGIRQKTGFAKKIMLMSAIPVVILGVILSVFTTIESYVILSRKFAEEVLALSASYGTAVENRISRLEESFNIVVMDPNVVDENLSMESRKALLEKAAGMTMLNDFSISYADGTTYNDTDISGREYFQYSMRNKTNYISSPVVRLTDGSITVMMGQYFSSGGQDYLAYGGMNIDVFNDVIHDVDNGEGSICFIIDKNKQIISTSSEDKLPLMTELSDMNDNKKFGELSGILGKLMSGDNGTTRGVLDGTEYIYGYVPIDSDEGWTIVVGTPTNAITSNIVRTAVISAVLMIVCVLIIIPIISGIVKRICAPITESSARLQLFAQGNVSDPAPKCSSNDEIQQMTESMDDMISTIGGYIRDIHSVLSAISDGDLTVTPTADFRGDFLEIKNSMNLILDSLNQTMIEVETSASQVKDGAVQLADGSTNLSQGAIQQAADIDRITTTVSDIAVKTEENNNNVKKALASSQSANDKAQDSQRCMDDLMQAISEIEESSREIGNIISVISDISFQTNILALNASIEAARAGEAGKGFAVVADEVGNLATKSSEATQQTGDLINKSITMVNKGVELARKTAASLAGIVEGVAEVSAAMNEIAEASETQAAAVEEISEGIKNVDSAIHNTTATAEQSAAESEELSALALTLSNAVSRFNCVKNVK